MPKQARILTALEVGKLGSGTHAVGGVPGLYITKVDNSEAWTLKITINGKRRNLGLGSAREVSLNDARTSAAKIRADVRNGVDVLAERAKRREEAKARNAPTMTFAKAANDYIQLLQKTWTNEKHSRQWPQTINDYVNPVIGDMPISEVDTRHVIEILSPIFYTKTETAKRVRARMEKIFAWAIFNGYREKANPAIWRGHLDNVFINPPNASTHFPALPYVQAPEFMMELRQREGMTARALEFVILTSARAKEATRSVNQKLFATWDQVDMEGLIWTRPAGLMKTGASHRIPLSEAAMGLLESLPHRSGVLFPSDDSDKPVTTGAMLSLIRRMHEARIKNGDEGFVDPAQNNEVVTTHGFRSTFRDWASDMTEYPRDMIETAMAHTIENKAERAYRRKDMLERRRDLMNDWAAYLNGER